MLSMYKYPIIENVIETFQKADNKWQHLSGSVDTNNVYQSHSTCSAISDKSFPLSTAKRMFDNYNF